jgi:hypothetical protein
MSIQDIMKMAILIGMAVCWVAMQYCHNDQDFQKRKKKQ